MSYEEKSDWFYIEPNNRVTCGRLRNVGGDINNDLTINYENSKITVRVNWSAKLTRYNSAGNRADTNVVPKRVILWRLIGNLDEHVNPSDPSNVTRWKCVKVFNRAVDNTVVSTWLDTLPVVDDQSTRDTYFQILKCRRALYYKVEYISEYMHGFSCPLFVYADGCSVVALSTHRQIFANKPYDDCEQVWRYINSDNDVPFVRIVVDPLEHRATFITEMSYLAKRKVVWATRADGKIFCLDYYTGNLINSIDALGVYGKPLFAVALNPITCELLYAANRTIYRVWASENGVLINERVNYVNPQLDSSNILSGWEGEEDGSNRTFTAQTGAVCTVSTVNSSIARFYVIYQNEKVAVVPIDTSVGISKISDSGVMDIGRMHFGCSAKTRANQYNVYGITNAIDQAVWVNGHTPLDYCYEVNRNLDGRGVKISGLCEKYYVNRSMSQSQAERRAQTLLGFTDANLQVERYRTTNSLLASALRGETVPMPNYAVCYRDPDNDVHVNVYRESCVVQNVHPDSWRQYWKIMSHNGQWGQIGCKFGLPSNGNEFRGRNSAQLGEYNRKHVDRSKGYIFNGSEFMPAIHQTISGRIEPNPEPLSATVLQDIGFVYGCSIDDNFGGCNNFHFSNGQIESDIAEDNYEHDYRPDIRARSASGTSDTFAKTLFHPFTSNNDETRSGWWGTCPKPNTLSGDIAPSDHWVIKPYKDRDTSIPQSSWDVPMSQLGIGASLPDTGYLKGNNIGINNQIKDDYYIYQVDYQEDTLHKIIIDNGASAQVGIEPLLMSMASGYNDFTFGTFKYVTSGDVVSASRPTHVIADDFNCVWVICSNSIYRIYPSTLSGVYYPAAEYPTESYYDELGYIYDQSLYNSTNNMPYFLYGQYNGNFIDVEFGLICKWRELPSGKPVPFVTFSDARKYDLDNPIYWAEDNNAVKLFPKLNDSNKFYYARQEDSNIDVAGQKYCYKLRVVENKINGDDGVFGNEDAHVTYNEYNSDNLGMHAYVALGETSVYEITHPAYKTPSVSLRIIDSVHTNPVLCDDPDPECDDSGLECSAKWSKIIYENDEALVMPSTTNPEDIIALAVRGYDNLATKHLLEFTDIENFVVGKSFLVAEGTESSTPITYKSAQNISDDAIDGSLTMWLPNDIFWKIPNVYGGDIPVNAERSIVESRIAGDTKQVKGGIEVGVNVYEIATEEEKTAIYADQVNDIFLYERWSEPAYCINGVIPGMYGYENVIEKMWGC